MTDLFFYLSKIFWVVVQPDHFLLLMLLLGLLLWNRLSGVLLVWGSVLSFFVISLFPVANFLLEPLEQRFPQPDLSQLSEPIAGVIVLGGGEDAERSAIHQRAEFNQGAERLMVVPELLTRFPEVKVLFTGGSGSLIRPDYRGGDVALQWLSQQGLEKRAVIERESRNTFQNAIYSRELINERADLPEGRWILVTSAFHMPRSVGVFRQAGIDVLPFPVDFRTGEMRFHPDLNWNMGDLNTAVREWIGIAVYYLTDKTSELLPAPEPGVNRL
ncbi:YdcF family protein [uncultured Neptuniibacter sp.]|uniref:YdcF family protein n=1 Tax=uncultured Neptuniibacter sp. TaxID=502143 RepID=UPI002611BAA7|nr:YdcF family protein [uncultured Neptuniibacter sp.]